MGVATKKEKIPSNTSYQHHAHSGLGKVLGETRESPVTKKNQTPDQKKPELIARNFHKADFQDGRVYIK